MNYIDQYDELYLLLQRAGYENWCTVCGRDNMTHHYECKGGECEAKARHEDHCHEHRTELCIPRSLKTVKHWLDCDCP